MGFTIQHVSHPSNRGKPIERIEDDGEITAHLPQHAAFPILSGIDVYGTTYFNGQQIPDFLVEWRRFAEMTTDAHGRKTIDRVTAMAERIQNGRGFLEFIGD